MSTEAMLEARRAARSPWVERLARLGLAAKGISYAMVAVLAIEVAIGRGGTTTDRQGALRQVADEPLGRWLLIALAVGFAAYALWRFVEAILDRSGEGDDASALAKRLGYFARGCVYVALCAAAVSVLAGDEGGGGGEEKRAAGGILDWPAGRWLVLAIAAGVAGASLWNAYRGLSGKFEEKLGGMDEGARRFAQAVGVVGHLARAVVFGIVAWFLAKAAVQYDPDEAVGLDGALARLVAESHGKVLLGVVAAGLLAYGLYSLVEARYRRV
jgi:hypothetical protein